MRIEREVVSLSWIPSEAIGGTMKMPFELGITHYDTPPPDRIDDIEALNEADRFRFANRLRAWIDVDDSGAILDAGYSGGVLMGSTTVLKGRKAARTFEAFAMPTIQQHPEITDGRARFVQTTGGRTGVPAPRRVNHPPFMQWEAPLVWSTMALTVHADGRTEVEVLGASPFPRHWFYGANGELVAKTGITDFKEWYRHAFGEHTPWGDQHTPALVTAAESALERALSNRIMRGGEKPEIRKVKEGARLATQGEPGHEVYLILDGVVRVEVDGDTIADMGPGAVFGERALLEGGRRTATLTAMTPCRVAVADVSQIDRHELAGVAEGHRREEQREQQPEE